MRVFKNKKAKPKNVRSLNEETRQKMIEAFIAMQQGDSK